MRGGETNGNMLDSNISRGHGHQSRPSTLRSAGVTGVRCSSRHMGTKHTQKRKHTHISSGRAMTSTGHGAEGARKVTNRLSWCVATR
jgi:hypothetical protein